jgi:hypothetical protein
MKDCWRWDFWVCSLKIGMKSSFRLLLEMALVSYGVSMSFLILSKVWYVIYFYVIYFPN